MTGTIENLSLAVAAFLGAHFILSSLPVRQGIIGLVGKGVFRGLYSLVSLAAFVWMLRAYGAAPDAALWQPAPALQIIPLLAMPIACVLAVAGLTTRSVTGVGGEALLGDPHPVRGIMTITRHPFLCGVALWGAAHIAANGDVASVLLFGGVTALALGGMAHIDYRRRQSTGPTWGPVAMGSSAIPFLAAIQNRVKIDWPGIGLPRILAGLALYAAIVAAHEFAFGVAEIP